jgi:aspartate-semialdehyde dehydrogenase
MPKKAYKVIVVGIGMVGSKMVQVLLERKKLPLADIKILATRERYEKVAGKKFLVKKAAAEEFDGYDLALFAGTEGASGASKLFGWEAVRRGCVVIDNGKDFRMDEKVPLVIPEINGEALRGHHGFIANPNCSTIIALMALGPIHRAAGIKRFVASTYQAVSGTGSAAFRELAEQMKTIAAGKKCKPAVYPVQIAGNVIPQISKLCDDPPGPYTELMPGYFEEEIKMQRETRKILGDRRKRIRVSATCVRVPVFNAHSESINVQTVDKLSVKDARKLLAKAPGVRLLDEPEKGVWPYPLMGDGIDDVFVGRVREDLSAKNCLDLFVVGDNIRKGAASNAVQIAEKMMELKLI